MNGNDILRSMNGLDEKYIASARREIAAKHKGFGRRSVSAAVAIAAAVALMTVSAGAVYTQFSHKAAVQEYFTEESIKYIENKGLALNYTDENEHIKLTLDTMLSDGHIGSMILTIDGLDEAGLECVQKRAWLEIYLTDAQTGEYVTIHDNGSPEIIGGGKVDFDACTATQYTMRRELQLDQIDTDRDYILTFGMNTLDSSEYKAERDEHQVLTDNVMEGISFETSFRPNVAVKELENENGEKLWLSQIGYYSNELGVISKRRDHSVMRLLRKDSVFKDGVGMSAETLDRSPERSQPLACGWFDSIVDIEKYKGIETEGTKYIEIK